MQIKESTPNMNVKCWKWMEWRLQTYCLLTYILGYNSRELQLYTWVQWEFLYINPLWPSDTTWRQRSGSTLVQGMACCLTAPNPDYLNQCWLMISEALWHSPDSNFTENTSDIYCWNEFEIYKVETVAKSPRGQCDRMKFVFYWIICLNVSSLQ